jgi:DNA-directed RNA polymerase specialized sigma subunit
MDTKQKERILNDYCRNELQKLKKLCYPKICRIGGISQMDHDDLYSIALDALRDSADRFDEKRGGTFEAFLSGNINRKFSSYIRDKNSGKKTGRTACSSAGNTEYIQVISFDALYKDDAHMEEMIDSGFCMEEEVFAKAEFASDNKVEKYLDRLSKIQRKIVLLLADGYLQDEIRKLLRISKKEYSDHMLGIRAYENVKVLF